MTKRHIYAADPAMARRQARVDIILSSSFLHVPCFLFLCCWELRDNKLRLLLLVVVETFSFLWDWEMGLGGASFSPRRMRRRRTLPLLVLLLPLGGVLGLLLLTEEQEVIAVPSDLALPLFFVRRCPGEAS